jgi:prophage antirepressor-like protein
VLDAMGSSVPVTTAQESIIKGLGKGFTNGIPLQTAGGVQDTTIISEPAATFLVARSNTEQGRKLNRWLHTEVLPSIRKTGTYAAQLPQKRRQRALPQEFLSMWDLAIRVDFFIVTAEDHSVVVGPDIESV